ncbi:hypothetical protein [Undibacterium sp. Ren11W]|uniref:hypothetical protein n=1 Tax=Undibacterium sp. Ren11W TaxID=3413045 RepID=UPI003BF15816
MTKKSAKAPAVKAPAAKPVTDDEKKAVVTDGQGSTGKSDTTTASENSDVTGNTNGLEVTSKQDGFRRAGLIWSREATRILLADLTDEQYVALLTEPMLNLKPVII